MRGARPREVRREEVMDFGIGGVREARRGEGKGVEKRRGEGGEKSR